MYVDNSVSYDGANAIIDNMQVIQDAIKKSGFKYRIIAPPSSDDSDEIRTKDISRR
jgi:isopropylmalate/homocitrate/citramalate synthase